MQKQVGPNHFVAKLWVNKVQSFARNPKNNFYFRNRTIYSYRDSYAVATFLGCGEKLDVILKNSERGLSATTTNHHSAVESAIRLFNAYYEDGSLRSGYRVFHSPLSKLQKPYEDHLLDIVEEYRKMIDLVALQAKRARVNQEWRLREFAGITNEAKRFLEYFNLDCDISPRTVTQEQLDLMHLTLAIGGSSRVRQYWNLTEMNSI